MAAFASRKRQISALLAFSSDYNCATIDSSNSGCGNMRQPLSRPITPDFSQPLKCLLTHFANRKSENPRLVPLIRCKHPRQHLNKCGILIRCTCVVINNCTNAAAQ